MRTIKEHLLKPSPDHVSVVGPAYYGKSVVLSHLAASFRNGSDGYLTASHIDLRHGVPASDREFMYRFAQEIKAALQGARPNLAGEINAEDEAVHEVLGLVLEDLESEGVRLLVVLDGFDYALAGTGLTRNLWDRLRALAQRDRLVCTLLQRLWEEPPGTRLSKSEIDRTAEEVLAGPGQLLAALWDDCDDELRADLGILNDGDVPLTELSEKRRRAIEERGYGRVSRNRLRSSCRLMQHYAKAQAPAIADLTRLLGTSAGFETHVRSLLELRLAQVSSETTDEDLLDFVSNAIRDLTPTPEHALIWVRSIANRALQLVWYAELPPDRTLPAQWREEWEREEVRYTDDGGRLPRSPGAQCNILRLATGTGRTSRQVRYITKTTFLLLDHLQSVGNFGQHRDEFPEIKVTVGFAASIVFAAISLLECLTHDLAAADTG